MAVSGPGESPIMKIVPRDPQNVPSVDALANVLEGCDDIVNDDGQGGHVQAVKLTEKFYIAGDRSAVPTIPYASRIQGEV